MQEYTLTDEGRNYLKYGLPEMRLIELLMSGPVDFTEAKEKVEKLTEALRELLTEVDPEWEEWTETDTLHLSDTVVGRARAALNLTEQGEGAVP